MLSLLERFPAMMRFALLPALAAALPHHPDLIESIESADLSDENGICLLGPCRKPTNMQYESLFNTQPGVQWMTYGGYCGSWSIQRAAMAKGASTNASTFMGSWIKQLIQLKLMGSANMNTVAVISPQVEWWQDPFTLSIAFVGSALASVTSCFNGPSG